RAMRNVKPSRIALALSLVVLGGSLATLVSATGAASAITADTAHEFAVEDGALVTTVDGRTKTLVPDVGTVERITVTTVDGRLLVRTEPLAPPDVSVTQRARAKQIVTDEPAIANTIDAAGGAVYTIRPVPDGVSSDRAAVVGADAERPWNHLVLATDAAFVARDSADANALVLERERQLNATQRALVVVDLPNDDVRYSVVVNLDTERFESFVRLDPTMG
ncbi:hypothetical protein SAMN05216388_10851, partial [Halorientalis persicus]